jgi:glyoxylase I family protein
MVTGTDHIAIQASDFPRALDFYHRLLGLPLVKGPFGHKDRLMCYLQAGAIGIELYSTKFGEGLASLYTNDRGGLDHISFTVADIDAAVATLRQAGVTIVKPPFRPATGEPEVGRIAFINGPDGQEIELREDARIRDGF